MTPAFDTNTIFTQISLSSIKYEVIGRAIPRKCPRPRQCILVISQISLADVSNQIQIHHMAKPPLCGQIAIYGKVPLQRCFQRCLVTASTIQTHQQQHL